MPDARLVAIGLAGFVLGNAFFVLVVPLVFRCRMRGLNKDRERRRSAIAAISEAVRLRGRRT